MKKGHYKTVTVPATTNNITRGIINFLNSEGHCAVRINVMGIYDEEIQAYKRGGGTVGVLDIQCTLYPTGQTLVIDVKKGNDTVKPAQAEYAQNVIRCGGYAFFAKDVEALKEYYYTMVKPNLKK